MTTLFSSTFNSFFLVLLEISITLVTVLICIVMCSTQSYDPPRFLGNYPR